MAMTQQNVRVLMIEEDGGYTAQMLEFDFAARGRTADEALRCLQRLVVGHARLNASRGRRPFDGVSVAPVQYWRAWKRIAELAEDDAQLALPPAYVVDAHLRNLYHLQW